jgi:hypothetical protein
MAPARSRGFGVRHRIDGGWRGGNASQRGGFRDAELVQGFAEIHFGGGSHAVSALAKENLIHIQREYLLLGEFGLHQQRNVDFAHLALHIALRRQEHAARHLHGDGAGALADAAGLQIGYSGPEDALPVDAVMPEEAIILGGQEGLDQFGRQLVVADRYSTLLADGLDQLAVPGIDAQGHLQLYVL